MSLRVLPGAHAQDRPGRAGMPSPASAGATLQSYGTANMLHAIKPCLRDETQDAKIRPLSHEAVGHRQAFGKSGLCIRTVSLRVDLAGPDRSNASDHSGLQGESHGGGDPPACCVSGAAGNIGQHPLSLKRILALACQSAWKHHQHPPVPANLHTGWRFCTQHSNTSPDIHLFALLKLRAVCVSFSWPATAWQLSALQAGTCDTFAGSVPRDPEARCLPTVAAEHAGIATRSMVL